MKAISCPYKNCPGQLFDLELTGMGRGSQYECLTCENRYDQDIKLMKYDNAKMQWVTDNKRLK